MKTRRSTTAQPQISSAMLHYLKTGEGNGDLDCFLCHGLPEVADALAAARAATPGEAFPWAEKEVRRLKKMDAEGKAWRRKYGEPEAAQ